MPDSSDDIVIRRQGRIGRITLNRPQAFNALSLSMIHSIGAALQMWRDEPAVHAVVIDGAGDRAFCAGGDIRAIYALSLAGDHAGVEAFFAAEYALNLAIARFPKPYVALIDGICMGGGVGVSVHGSARVTTAAALFAMPEVGIGFFPDVGASYVLPRLRGASGMYMALTGARVTGADAVHIGLATHFTTRERMATLADELAEDGMAALSGTTLPAPEGTLDRAGDGLRCFEAGSVAQILERLTTLGTPWAEQAVAAMRAASPSAVLWSFELIRQGAGQELEACLQTELALARRCIRHPDLVEGVRAAVIDKDRAPRWSPARIEDVPATA